MLKRVIVAVLVAVAVAVSLVLGGHGLLPEFGGFTPVLESLLPWLGTTVPLLLLGALLARSRAAAAAALLPAAVWGVMFGPDLLRTAPGGPSDLSVATLNVGVVNDSSGLAVRTVAKGRDLFAAQELTPGGPAAAELDTLFPHKVQISTVGLWSRFPIVERSQADIGLDWVRALRAVVETPKGRVTVYVVHLASARPGETAQRDRTLAHARRLVDADDSERLLLLGDLNTATTDRKRADLVPPLLDAQEEAGTGFGFTWPASFPVTRPDHILYRGLTATSAGVEPAAGSDHRAAVASLRISRR
ncbi:endonuclease/exonuclease/phosphatase family protein [Planomonospora parontospora]|uniref:endonuclease/exonuclease/phosphatase family protein n=1 Tax=Planomonospora parontospora TaxID=58119 RepID=UPI001670AA64|nr:endonuclease/exonuclease/phosphatase family protein [Planomonospora parontospora]GGL20537.1 teicoplanin resistance protein VanJ [Planomonospora parontospora subsp. antibiotica]GII13587.1 teicoplanin resistance protein VanJ [Planomonospora parontospora subsp. antibiotica]